MVDCYHRRMLGNAAPAQSKHTKNKYEQLETMRVLLDSEDMLIGEFLKKASHLIDFSIIV